MYSGNAAIFSTSIAFSLAIWIIVCARSGISEKLSDVGEARSTEHVASAAFAYSSMICSSSSTDTKSSPR